MSSHQIPVGSWDETVKPRGASSTWGFQPASKIEVVFESNRHNIMVTLPYKIERAIL